MNVDILNALGSMRRGIFNFVKMIVQAVLFTGIAATIIAVVGFLVVKHFLIFLGLVFVLALGFWFWVEYNRARDIREYEELVKAINGKRKEW
jgi:zinc transporter ZupT